MPEKIRFHIYVTGRVQGVFFRYAAKRKASNLGVFGWVKNLPDGRVEAVLEGKEDAVEKMATWMKVGPPVAKVDKVIKTNEGFKDEFQTFTIL